LYFGTATEHIDLAGRGNLFFCLVHSRDRHLSYLVTKEAKWKWASAHRSNTPKQYLAVFAVDKTNMNRSRTKLFTFPRKNRRRFRKHRAFSAGVNGLLERLRQQNESDIIALPEYRARANLSNFLAGGGVTSYSSRPIVPPSPPPGGYKHILSHAQMLTTIDAAMATFHIHVESRIAALCGQGFYTIGPCGEGRKQMNSIVPRSLSHLFLMIRLCLLKKCSLQ
jgi:hypothetical protein